MGLVLRQEILKAQLTEERKAVFAHYLVHLVYVGFAPSKGHLDFISHILASEEEQLFSCSELEQARLILETINTSYDDDLDQDSTEIVALSKDKHILPKAERISLERLSTLWAQAELFLSTSICLAALDGVYSVEQARLISDYAHQLGFSAYRLSVLEKEVFQALHKAGSALVCERREEFSQNEFSIPSREQIFQGAEGVEREASNLERSPQTPPVQTVDSNDECLNQLKVQQLWNSDLEIVTKIDTIEK